jgi:DNA mismatch endonuclease, patch repair protein
LADIVSAEKRSSMMAGIRAKNTGPEFTIRRLLHRHGFRFRLHRPDLPGKPDLVLKRWQAIIHVHGCFWHGHDCHLFRLPATEPERWSQKLEANRQRDAIVNAQLKELGWRQLTVWECALKGREKLSATELMLELGRWLRSNEPAGDIRGRPSGELCEQS